MMKPRLVTPGPAMVPPDVLLELAKPVGHHRTPENQAAIAEVVEGLKVVFATQNPIVILTSSGTGAMEAAVANVLRPGQKAIVASAGKFGERWVELCRAFGVQTIHVQEEYGKAVPPPQVANALAEHRDAGAVFCTLSETSTGVGHDIEGMGRVVALSPALFVVDGISGVGAMECRTDEWGIDLLAVGSQKALMLPPGLAFLSVSPKARTRIEAAGPGPAYYFDLRKALGSAAKNDTPFTPAHTLIASLVHSLRRLRQEGIEQVWLRTRAMSQAMLAGIGALGLSSFAERPATALTAIAVPTGIDAAAWTKVLERKFGLKVAGGQGELKGRIIRIAHMGYMDPLDVVGIVAALEWSLAELGHPVESGKAVAAATRVFADWLATQRR